MQHRAGHASGAARSHATGGQCASLCTEGTEREGALHILARAVEGKSFEMLAEETRMEYKGVAAVYYRTVQKIKRKIEMKNEF